MSDTVRRPRGGWQVGARRDGQSRLHVHNQDVYSVSWDGETATVTHFADRNTNRKCCVNQVTITDEDRAKSFEFEGRKGGRAQVPRSTGRTYLWRSIMPHHSDTASPAPDVIRVRASSLDGAVRKLLQQNETLRRQLAESERKVEAVKSELAMVRAKIRAL